MPGEIEAYWRPSRREVAAVPRVRVASLGLDLPLSGLGMRQTFEIVGGPAPDPANRPLAQYHIIGAGYFDALGVPLVRGRAFTDRDSETRPRSASSTTRSCADSWPAASRSVRVSRSRVPGIRARRSRTVRSSASCVRSRRGQTRPADSVYQIYVPTAQSPWVMDTTMIVRTDAEPLQMVEQVKRAIARVDPTQAVSQVRTMERWLRASTARPRFRAQLVVAFAGLAATAGRGGDLQRADVHGAAAGARVQRQDGRGRERR